LPLFGKATPNFAPLFVVYVWKEIPVFGSVKAAAVAFWAETEPAVARSARPEIFMVMDV